MSIASEITRLEEAKEKLKLYSIGKISHPASNIDVVAQELLGSNGQPSQIREIAINGFNDSLADSVQDGMLQSFNFSAEWYDNLDCVVNYNGKQYTVFKSRWTFDSGGGYMRYCQTKLNS